MITRFGRRGVALILLGVAWVGFGLTILAEPPLVVPDAAIVMDYVPGWAQFVLWAATGAVAASAGSRRSWQPIGFAVAMAMPVIRVTSFAWSTIMWLVPGAPGGDSRSVGAGMFWLALLALIWTVSTWPDTTHLPSESP